LWRDTISTANAIQKCVVELRHAFGRGGGERMYIETVPKRGYRLVAKVERIDRSGSPRLVDDGNPDLTSGAVAIDASGAADRQAQRAADLASNGDTVTAVKSKSIAVLRFRNIGGNPAHEYFAQGLAEALHEGLSEVADLAVIERDRSFQHSITNETVQGIGKNLGVDHLLDGSVQQLDGRLRVSAALYRRSDGVRLYVYRDEEPLAKLRELQDRLIANVLTAVEVHLDERRADDMRRWGTQNVDAYLAAREANAFHMRLDQKSLQYAVERFRAAIAFDPGFVRAYRLLALTLGDIDTFTSGQARRGLVVDELAQIREAVKHLPGNADALTAVDICERKINTTSRRDREVGVRTAIQEEGTPHRAYSEYLEYADLLKTGHLFREASRYVDLYAKFESDQPALHHHRNELAGLTLGPQRATPIGKKVLTVFQNNIGTLFALVTQLALIGEHAEAEGYLARLEENDHVGVWAFALRLRLAALRGDLPARSQELVTALDDPRVNDYLRGVTHFILGDVESGVAAWRRVHASNSRSAARAMIYAVHAESCYTAKVVNDARYQDVLDELGVGRQWTAYLREKVAELAPITGIEPGDPAPQVVFLTR
jgi:TolB-like protein